MAVSRADKSLYTAKRLGRNRIVSEGDQHPDSWELILHIDDDPASVNAMRELARSHGWKVIQVPNGQAAVTAAAHIPISLVLADPTMKGAGGKELLPLLRGLPLLSRTPIVCLSSSGSPEDIVRGFHQGADDYVTKPFHPLELASRLQRLLTPRS
jgi:PleD family two-component response regulator